MNIFQNNLVPEWHNFTFVEPEHVKKENATGRSSFETKKRTRYF